MHIGLTTASANMRFIAYAKCLIHFSRPYPILFTQLIYLLCKSKILSVFKDTDAFLKILYALRYSI